MRLLCQDLRECIEFYDKSNGGLSPAKLGGEIVVAATAAHATTEPLDINLESESGVIIEAGYVADVREAFDVWLGSGCPAYVERAGASADEVIAIVHRAGGLVSLAHPGRTDMDARIAGLCERGLDAIEVYHSDHDALAVRRYERMARDLGLLVTGGSDFHGDLTHGLEPGGATLPAREWERLAAARDRHAAG